MHQNYTCADLTCTLICSFAYRQAMLAVGVRFSLATFRLLYTHTHTSHTYTHIHIYTRHTHIHTRTYTAHICSQHTYTHDHSDGQATCGCAWPRCYHILCWKPRTRGSTSSITHGECPVVYECLYVCVCVCVCVCVRVHMCV